MRACLSKCWLIYFFNAGFTSRRDERLFTGFGLDVATRTLHFKHLQQKKIVSSLKAKALSQLRTCKSGNAGLVVSLGFTVQSYARKGRFKKSPFRGAEASRKVRLCARSLHTLSATPRQGARIPRTGQARCSRAFYSKKDERIISIPQKRWGKTDAGEMMNE